MQTNSIYWFNRSMDHLVREANELGEVIPRIKVFLKRDGDINQKDKHGDTLLARAKAAGLLKVVNYLESQGAKSEIVENTCAICFESINSRPVREEESERILDCSHVFHRECIGTWLIQRHRCPLCRAHVIVATPEAPRPEMTVAEILAVPDRLRPDAEILSLTRFRIQQVRRIRQLDLNENTPISRNAARVERVASVALRELFRTFEEFRIR